MKVKSTLVIDMLYYKLYKVVDFLTTLHIKMEEREEGFVIESDIDRFARSVTLDKNSLLVSNSVRIDLAGKPCEVQATLEKNYIGHCNLKFICDNQWSVEIEALIDR